MHNIEWNDTFKYKYVQVRPLGTAIQYVILDSDLKPLCNPFYCKEYFQDITWAEKFKKAISQYGLSYEGKGNVNKLRIGLRRGEVSDGVTLKYDNKQDLNIDNVKGLLEQLRERLNIKGTDEVIQCENGLILTPCEEWYDNPLYTSILLQSIRYTNKFNPKKNLIYNIEQGHHSQNYLIERSGGWTQKLYLLTKGLKFDCNWKDFNNSGEAHNSGLNTININKLIIE